MCALKDFIINKELSDKYNANIYIDKEKEELIMEKIKEDYWDITATDEEYQNYLDNL